MKQHCLGGGGDESLVQNKKVQSVPGLLATIVDATIKDMDSHSKTSLARKSDCLQSHRKYDTFVWGGCKLLFLPTGLAWHPIAGRGFI